MNVVIVGCSRRKVRASAAVPALDLYEGGCVPRLRARIATRAELRPRVFILSAQYGLLGADDLIVPYDRALTLERALELQPTVGQATVARIVKPFVPEEMLVVVEPLYLVMLTDLFALRQRPRVHWVPDPANGWHQAAAILDDWGWQ